MANEVVLHDEPQPTEPAREIAAPVIVGQCVNCGHDDHHGERCDGLADDEFCACSWPDPSNFTAEIAAPVIVGQCVNCGHDDHHGERCDGLADDEFCACSWPDPSNFTAEIPPVDKVPFTTDHLLAHLQIEADFVVDRAFITRGQRLVLRDLLQRAHDEIERLNDENEGLRIDLSAAYCRMDDMEGRP